ncbi:glycosyltransferase family 2 protein [Aegicerativicinus sediminis]
MKLSIVIVSYNVLHFLELCVQSIMAATESISSEIIVVDNNSNDGTVHYLSEKYPLINFIALSQNLGFSKANNIGVKAAKGAFVCILNPDTIVSEKSFYNLMEMYNDNNNMGIIGCKLIDGSGQFLPESKRNFVKPFGALKKIGGLSSNYYAQNIGSDQNGNVEVLVGAFMFLKRKLYIEVGGFDEDYFMYGEDFDLSYKVEQLGKRNFYFGESTAIHFKGESTTNDIRYKKHFYEAMHIFHKKHFKPNRIYSLVSRVIFKVLPYFKASRKPVEFDHNLNLTFISKKELSQVQTIFPEAEMVLSPKNLQIESDRTYVFDIDTLTFTEIIKVVEGNNGNTQTRFLFWPSKTSYIIGSFNAQSKGIVVQGKNT